MCHEIESPTKIINDAKAFFQKGNEPECLWFRVQAHLCSCGNQWWVRTKDGYWVKADIEGGI